MRDSYLIAVHRGSGEAIATGICPAISGATPSLSVFLLARIAQWGVPLAVMVAVIVVKCAIKEARSGVCHSGRNM